MSLTIQAPHANMNAYEIGDDETRKNKVSDKIKEFLQISFSSIYLHFIQIDIFI